MNFYDWLEPITQIAVVLRARRRLRYPTRNNIANTISKGITSKPVAGNLACETVIACENPIPLFGAYTAKVWLPDDKLFGKMPVIVTTP